jgi:uncharacterized protein with GYD domain
LIFINFGRFKKKPAKEVSAHVTKMLEDMKKRKIKILGFYWTLGRYDTMMILEAPNEKEAMKLSINAADVMTTETMVAIPREEAIKLL